MLDVYQVPRTARVLESAEERSALIVVRLTLAERAAWNALAAKARWKPSTLLRAIILDGLGDALPPAPSPGDPRQLTIPGTSAEPSPRGERVKPRRRAARKVGQTKGTDRRRKVTRHGTPKSKRPSKRGKVRR